jgi:hypothetical protein
MLPVKTTVPAAWPTEVVALLGQCVLDRIGDIFVEQPESETLAKTLQPLRRQGEAIAALGGISALQQVIDALWAGQRSSRELPEPLEVTALACVWHGIGGWRFRAPHGTTVAEQIITTLHAPNDPDTCALAGLRAVIGEMSAGEAIMQLDRLRVASVRHRDAGVAARDPLNFRRLLLGVTNLLADLDNFADGGLFRCVTAEATGFMGGDSGHGGEAHVVFEGDGLHLCLEATPNDLCNIRKAVAAARNATDGLVKIDIGQLDGNVHLSTYGDWEQEAIIEAMRTAFVELVTCVYAESISRKLAAEGNDR